ncbi:MAG: glycosyltransferase [Candidatus Nanopelagicales bacterium]
MILISFIVTLISLGLFLNTTRNVLLLRKKFPKAHQPRVSVLIPARNESESIPQLVASLKLQDYPDFHIVILDDDSSDNTFAIASDLTSGDSRFLVLQGEKEIPQGWLGKQWACHQLSMKADGEVLCFIDADVTLSPAALSASINQMFGLNVDLICPYPQQRTYTFFAQIVQPLLQWSWMATLPLDLAMKSPRPSLSAGNGQLLLVKRDVYTTIGGHESVKSEILEDIELVKEVKRSGGKGGVWDGSKIATCSMYKTNAELFNGYAKSLWKAFGSIFGGVAISLFLLTLFLQPLFFLSASDIKIQVLSLLSIGLVLLSRILVHRQFQYPISTSLLYPFSVMAFFALMMVSITKKQRGTITWKARALHG